MYLKTSGGQRGGQTDLHGQRGIPSEVMYAMDVYPVFPESLAAISAGIGKAGPFFDEARDRGYHQHGLLLYPVRAEASPGPTSAPSDLSLIPIFFITDVSVCCLHVTWWAYLEVHFKKPTFFMDMPATDQSGRTGLPRIL